MGEAIRCVPVLVIQSESLMRYLCTRCEVSLGDQLVYGNRWCEACCKKSGVVPQGAPIPGWVVSAWEALGG